MQGAYGNWREDETQRPRVEKPGSIFQMLGLVEADEDNGLDDPESHNENPWRPVMERKITQALGNSFLGFKKLVPVLKSEAQERAENAGVRKESQLRRAIYVLDKLAKLERDIWDEAMSKELMARCNLGDTSTD